MAGGDDGLSNAQAYFTQSAEAPPPANQEPDPEGQQYLGLANADQGKFTSLNTKRQIFTQSECGIQGDSPLTAVNECVVYSIMTS